MIRERLRKFRSSDENSLNWSDRHAGIGRVPRAEFVIGQKEVGVFWRRCRSPKNEQWSATARRGGDEPSTRRHSRRRAAWLRWPAGTVGDGWVARLTGRAAAGGELLGGPPPADWHPARCIVRGCVCRKPGPNTWPSPTILRTPADQPLEELDVEGRCPARIAYPVPAPLLGSRKEFEISFPPEMGVGCGPNAERNAGANASLA